MMPWLLSNEPPDLAMPGRESVVESVLARQMRVLAHPSELQDVRRQAETAAAEFGLVAAERYQFVFAVNEAVTNAIKHGRPAADGTIGVELLADGDALVCAVEDHGTFRPSSPESDPLAEGGRGLTLMARLMDDVELLATDAGTTVRLSKRRRAEAGLGDGSG